MHLCLYTGVSPETAVVAVDNEENELFMFTCTSNYVAVADKLDVLKLKLGICIDSRASRDYCPDQSKFITYRAVQQKITTANGRLLDVIGMGDLELELLNGSGKTKTVFKNAIQAPKMAFSLISISRLNRAGYSATFNKGMCTIRNPQSKTIAIIPHSDGLHKIVTTKQAAKSDTANAATGKMSISNAHRKLRHISCLAIKHAVTKGLIEGIDLDLNSKPDFCEACAKAKFVCQPFPKESEIRAERSGERMHWDLWGPASVKILNGNHYVAACINNATRQTKLYFQSKKTQTFDSYEKDEAYIETQMGSHIKPSHANWGGEFMLKELINHQDQKGTKHEFTVHDSPPQNRVSECGMRHKLNKLMPFS